jgi:adenosylcobalamin-dependent ribonucleoside-triphosphate reductase
MILSTFASDFVVSPGMPLSVWENKYARRKANGTFQSWGERVEDVVRGNFLLDPRLESIGNDAGAGHAAQRELDESVRLARMGIMAFAGRHLQHGDDTQRHKIMELHTNCSTALTSFQLFRLLLRGSGVGRDYSAACCRVNWENMPQVRLVLDESHRDFDHARFIGSPLESLRDARHKYDSESERVRWFTVVDSREGWAKCVEALETAAFHEKHADKLFVFDMTPVRAAGLPIMGLQGRPASGPIPFMDALAAVASIKAAGMKPWKQAMFIDHYLARCVVMGGARRAARMAVKTWRDRDVIDFVDVKRGGFLWSANDSLLVDAEFWKQAKDPRHSHARRVFEAATNAAYFDKTGEPGFINVDRLTMDMAGADAITGDTCISAKTYVDLHPRTRDMLDNILSHVKQLSFPICTNPCGEQVLATWGGYCVLGNLNLAVVDNVEDAFEAGRQTARYLIRTNLMPSDYEAEVRRTNRIGVGITAIHEFAWRKFGLRFRQMIDYDGYLCSDEDAGQHAGNMRWLRERHPAYAFWMFVDKLREESEKAADAFSLQVGLPAPHTVTNITPHGTGGKVLSITEGAHLPAMPYYLRWVQYKFDDPAITDLRARNYPVKDISSRYPDHVVVGFPTSLPIATEMGDALLTADQATPEEQFRWLRLLERFWLGPRGAQVSYTLKYDPSRVSYEQFMAMILEHQPTVRCCAVMPAGDDWRETEKVYGYVPEQPLTRSEYEELMARITPARREGYDDMLLACEGGACPIEADINV